MRLLRFCFALVFSCSLLAAAGVAEPTAPPSATPSPATPTAPPDFSALLASTRLVDAPGTGVIVGAIGADGTNIYKAGSSGNGVPLDEHTVFEIGSVTKTFTATILASMVLDKSVRLDDPVAKYLPRSVHVPTRDGKQITLLDLATQHSGLPRLPTNLDPTASDPYATYTVPKMYAFLSSYQLPRDPGASFEYSNYGIALLGQALANREHTSYAKLLQTRVLRPLGMSETALSSDMTAAMAARMASGHDGDGNPTAAWNFQAIAPAGAIRSTIADMLKYVRCNMGQGPLAQACLLAQQPRSTIPGSHIGLVWWIDDTTHMINHGGDTAGFHAWVAIAPDHRRGAVVLANGGGGTSDIAFHAVDPSYPVLPPQKSMPLDDATIAQYVGTYAVTGQPLTLTIARGANGLTVQLTGQPAVRMYASSKDHFYLKIAPANIDFNRNGSGDVSGLIVHQAGVTLIAVKPGVPQTTPQPSPSPTVVLDTATLDSYAGTYLVQPGVVFTVKRDGDKLMVQLTGQPFFQVFPSSKDHFYYTVVTAQIDFERDANGRVIDLVLHQNGRDLTAVKQ